jgi:hypothetical protein
MKKQLQNQKTSVARPKCQNFNRQVETLNNSPSHYRMSDFNDRAPTPTPTVLAASQMELSHFDQVPHAWFDHIKTEKGQTDTTGVLLLANIFGWYQPRQEKDDAGKRKPDTRRFAMHKLTIRNSTYVNRFKVSKNTIRRSLRNLERLGLITIEICSVTRRNGKLLSNVMLVEPVVETVRQISGGQPEGAASSKMGESPSAAEGILPKSEYPSSKRERTYTNTLTNNPLTSPLSSKEDRFGLESARNPIHSDPVPKANEDGQHNSEEADAAYAKQVLGYLNTPTAMCTMVNESMELILGNSGWHIPETKENRKAIQIIREHVEQTYGLDPTAEQVADIILGGYWHPQTVKRLLAYMDRTSQRTLTLAPVVKWNDTERPFVAELLDRSQFDPSDEPGGLLPRVVNCYTGYIPQFDREWIVGQNPVNPLEDEYPDPDPPKGAAYHTKPWEQYEHDSAVTAFLRCGTPPEGHELSDKQQQQYREAQDVLDGKAEFHVQRVQREARDRLQERKREQEARRQEMRDSDFNREEFIETVRLMQDSNHGVNQH